MTALNDKKLLLFSVFAMFLFFSTVNAQQNEEQSYEETEQELEQLEEDMQPESEFEEVRESADEAYEELDAEFIDDTSDSSEVIDLTEEPEALESDSLDVEVDIFDTEPDTSYIYATEPSYNETKVRRYHNQKIIDKTDRSAIIFGRTYRQPNYALANPANIGVKSETLWGLTLPVLPLPNFGFSLQNSAFSVATMNTYFNDGRILTEEELNEFVDLFYESGLGLKTQVSLPSLFTLRFPVGFGSMFINTGLVVDQDGTLPGEVLAIPFKGMTFNEAIYTENLDMVIGTYVKTNVGYGTNIELLDYLDLRAGISANIYAGSFASVNTEEMTILSTPDSISLSGAAVTTLLDFDNLDAGSIVQINPGFDIGVGVRVRLGELLPMPELLYNDVDLQIALQDLNAKLSSGSMIQTRYTISGAVQDLEQFSDDDALDSLLVDDEVVLKEGFVADKDIATKLNMFLSYQPLSFVMLQAGITQYLTEGLGYDENMHWSAAAYLYPAKWFSLNTGVKKTYNEDIIYNSGFAFSFRNYDLGMNVHFIGGIDENVKGIGISMVNNLYF